MTQTLKVLAPLLSLVGVSLSLGMAACSDESEAPTPVPVSDGAGTGKDGPTAAKPTSPSPQGVQPLGQFEAHFEAKTRKLTFRPINVARTPGGPTVGPQGFGEVRSGLLDVTTESAVIGPDPSFNGGVGCAANRLCAIVSVANTAAGRSIDNTYVEVTSVTPAGFVGANSDAVPTGYPVSASLGLWAHNNLPSGGSSSSRWDFTLPDPDSDFTFAVMVHGTFLRASYGSSEAQIAASLNTLDNAGTFRNACASPIVQVPGSPFLKGAASGADNSGSEIALPFPFTLYDVTFDTDLNPYLLINTNGAIGFQSPGTDANVTLPDGSSLYDYTIFPFWDAVTPGPGGVCVGVEGTELNRAFVVTWLNATVGGTTNLSFSAVLHERTDQIEFQYNRWSSTSTNCASIASGPVRGSSATVGVQGPGGQATLSRFNTSFLPVHPSACPGPGYAVTLNASVANP